MTSALNIAHLDAQLSARIVSRRRLIYSTSASPALDRPAFVRAASGITWFGDRLAIIQDDASFIALVDANGERVEALPLLARDGVRQFDKSRDNKKHKLDLECCFTTQTADGEVLFALGSGSTRKREHVVSVRALPGGYDLRQIEASGLYAALNDTKAFSGSELNLEGATVRGAELILWQRGNGEAKHDLLPLNATSAVNLTDFMSYLADPETAPAPSLKRVRSVDLGSIAGVPLTFTDASELGRDLSLFLASAEASPNTFDDGAVVGAAVGIMDGRGDLRLTHLVDETGGLCRDKVEGIVMDRDDRHRAWVVADPDDHTQAACLFEVILAGPWT